MKKIMLLSMLAILVIADPSNATEMKSLNTAPAGVWIKLLISLHRPKMDCQRGFGLCFAVSWGLEERSEGASEENLCLVKGQLNERNQLVIEIEESILSRYEGGSALPYFKDKTSISILDSYTLPDATSKALGSSTPLTVKPGIYPVIFGNGSYTVVFQL